MFGVRYSHVEQDLLFNIWGRTTAVKEEGLPVVNDGNALSAFDDV